MHQADGVVNRLIRGAFEDGEAMVCFGGAHVQQQRDRRRDLAVYQRLHEAEPGQSCSAGHRGGLVVQVTTLERSGP
jgi:hypothetical protein